MPPGSHRAFVEAWLRRRARGLSAPGVLQLADAALAVLWRRAGRALSELTLAAVARSALEAASREAPALSDARLTVQGFDLSPLRPGEHSAGELEQALHALLCSLLSVVGELTGELIAPALCGELLDVPAPRSRARPLAKAR